MRMAARTGHSAAPQANNEAQRRSMVCPRSSNSLFERIPVPAVYSGDSKENAEPTNLTKMNPA